MKNDGTVRTADGLDLAWRAWLADEPKGIIVLVHGLAEHGNRHAATALFLADAGWHVYSVDLRAHGFSPDPPRSKRVHVDRFTDYFLDVDAVRELAESKHPGLPVLIFGHSMGGLISLSYVLEKPRHVAGAVISSPALATHPDFQPPALLKMLVGLLSKLAPRLRFATNLPSDAVSRDESVVRDYENDPLVTDKVSARWFDEVEKAMQAVFENAPKLERPVLLMQSGADGLVDPAAAERWAALAPQNQAELVIWPGLFHEMFNEPEKERVRNKTLAWLDSHFV